MTVYGNYGSMPLNEQIMKIWPWVGAEDARRLADECAALPEPSPIARLNKPGRRSEKAYRYAKHIDAEARKLKAV